MITRSSDVSFYVDTLIVEALLSDPVLSKTAQAAGLISQIADKVKGYVSNQINPDDKAGSLLSILAPGVISVTFSALGLPWLGMLLGFAMKFLNIDVKGILRSIYDKIKGLLSGGKQVTSAEVDNAVSSAVQEHDKPATQEDAEKAQALSAQQKTSSLLREARLFKLAMMEFDSQNMQINKSALPSILSLFSAKKSSGTNLLSIVLRWIFKIAIASAGLMVAGDVVNKFLGRPNALDGSKQNGKPVNPDAQQQEAAHAATQTRFKLQPGYQDERKNAGINWEENVPNTETSISQMLVTFAKQVYQGLDGLEPVIQGSSIFQVIVDKIAFFNHAAAGNSTVYIPKYFTSKKQLVDMFIDDVAKKAPK